MLAAFYLSKFCISCDYGSLKIEHFVASGGLYLPVPFFRNSLLHLSLPKSSLVRLLLYKSTHLLGLYMK